MRPAVSGGRFSGLVLGAFPPMNALCGMPVTTSRWTTKKYNSLAKAETGQGCEEISEDYCCLQCSCDGTVSLSGHLKPRFSQVSLASCHVDPTQSTVMRFFAL